MVGSGKIGVFDSGMGGLRTLKALRDALPELGYVYLADLAHAPYGGKTHEEIFELTHRAVLELKQRGCSLIILACNTASSEALRQLQKLYLPERDTFRILGILVPVAEAAAEISATHTIGVLATAATIQAGAYEREIRKCTPNAHITPVACPLLVPLIESNRIDTPACAAALDEYCAVVTRAHCDTVILGCTHYGFVKPHIEERLGSAVHIVDETLTIAQKTKDYLQRHELFAQNIARDASLVLYTSKASEHFDKRCMELFEQAPVLSPIE